MRVLIPQEEGRPGGGISGSYAVNGGLQILVGSLSTGGTKGGTKSPTESLPYLGCELLTSIGDDVRGEPVESAWRMMMMFCSEGTMGSRSA